MINIRKKSDRQPFRPQSPRLMDQVREVLRYHHYALKTEKAYVGWIRQFILFNDTRHPKDMGKEEVERFLSHLAINRNVAVATQNQAFNAILFLYKQVLGTPIDDQIDSVRARKPRKLPTVLSKSEVSALLDAMKGSNQLMAKLMYGCGLRLSETIRLRTQDVDFENNYIKVHDGKGGNNRVTVFPKVLHGPMKRQLESTREIFDIDLDAGNANVYLPDALARKYPNASRSWAWQYVFPARNLSTDPRSKAVRRHHAHETNIQKAVARARVRADIAKRISPSEYRHTRCGIRSRRIF